MEITKAQVVDFFGNVSKAAAALDISPQTLARRDRLEPGEQDAAIGAGLRLKGFALTKAMWPKYFNGGHKTERSWDHPQGDCTIHGKPLVLTTLANKQTGWRCPRCEEVRK